MASKTSTAEPSFCFCKSICGVAVHGLSEHLERPVLLFDMVVILGAEYAGEPPADLPHLYESFDDMRSVWR